MENPPRPLGSPDQMAALIFLSMLVFQPWRALMCFHPHVLVPQRSV